jgi:hypothetical protein
MLFKRFVTEMVSVFIIFFFLLKLYFVLSVRAGLSTNDHSESLTTPDIRERKDHYFLELIHKLQNESNGNSTANQKVSADCNT